MRAWIGKFIVGIGVVHTTFGLVFLMPILLVLWQEGLVNTVNGQADREFAFWFLAFGVLAMIFGFFLDWFERNHVGLPAFLGWSLLVFTCLIVVIMPISGGWLMFVPAAGILWKAMRTG